MNDNSKSKMQLIEELSVLRQELSELKLAKSSSASTKLLHHEDEFKTLVENAPDAIMRFN